MKTLLLPLVVLLGTYPALSQPGNDAKSPAAGSAAQSPAEPTLSWAPRRVFRAEDPGKQRTTSAYFTLIVDAADAPKCVLTSLEITIRGGGVTVSRQTYEAAALAAMRLDRTPTQLLLRVRATAPTATPPESVECALRVSDGSGVSRTLTVTAPVGTYEQRTRLIFPFRGRGLITQGGVHDGGHSNRSGQFAVDAIGATEDYCPQVADNDTNEAAAGWGREIIAPAGGVVALTRNDRPDQPVTGTSDRRYLLAEFAAGGDPGNFVVIDHENGEFSMLAHFQAGSVVVSKGQRLAQGDTLGRLGNAGDTNFPHVHYQLMDGPEWLACDGLPCRFENMPASLTRGTWFNAKP